MLNKINVCRLVEDHFKTLYDFKDPDRNWPDLALFFGVPILIASSLIYFGLPLSDTIISVLIGGYTILTGLLFNLLLIIFDFIKKQVSSSKDPDQNSDQKIRLRLLRETFSNMSFCILVSIFLAILATFKLFHVSHLDRPIDFILYFGSTNFVLTLIMILKRVHAIILKEFESYSGVSDSAGNK